MNPTYVVQVFDRAGEFSSVTVSFDALLEEVARIAARYRDKVVVVFNVARVDGDYDGLMDDERTAVSNAVRRAREETGQ